MNDERPQLDIPVVLHVEVAVGLLIAAVLAVVGGIVSVWTKDSTYFLTALVLALGTVFVAACIPQIRAARELRDLQRKDKP